MSLQDLGLAGASDQFRTSPRTFTQFLTWCPLLMVGSLMSMFGGWLALRVAEFVWLRMAGVTLILAAGLVMVSAVILGVLLLLLRERDEVSPL